MFAGPSPSGGVKPIPVGGELPVFDNAAGFAVITSTMMKLCIFVGTTIGGYAFWWLADSVLGLGFGWAFIISGVGSIVGVVAGWKLARRLEE